MILNRLGNKSKISDKIIEHFPMHTVYIEPFFGAGGLFFNKPKAQYNILNDADKDIYNLFMVVMKHKEELRDTIYKMPINEALWHHWRSNREEDPILCAVRFLLLSNFGYMGKSETLRFRNGNLKELLLNRLDKTFDLIWNVEFMCCDFRDVFTKIPLKDDRDVSAMFMYLDPPYLDTTNNYEQGFTHQDSEDLFNIAVNQPIKFALSEFDHPFILEQAKKHKLTVHTIGERQNMKNRRLEILITNYTTPQLKMFQ